LRLPLFVYPILLFILFSGDPFDRHSVLRGIHLIIVS